MGASPRRLWWWSEMIHVPILVLDPSKCVESAYQILTVICFFIMLLKFVIRVQWDFPSLSLWLRNLPLNIFSFPFMPDTFSKFADIGWTHGYIWQRSLNNEYYLKNGALYFRCLQIKWRSSTLKPFKRHSWSWRIHPLVIFLLKAYF